MYRATVAVVTNVAHVGRTQQGIADGMDEHIGMNRSAFCTFFRKHTGQTFVDYLNAYRVDLACHLLEREGLSVTEACYASGFNDAAYFCRTFKRYKGIPPSKIKK